jgi:hypothetical protein
MLVVEEEDGADVKVTLSQFDLFVFAEVLTGPQTEDAKDSLAFWGGCCAEIRDLPALDM